MYKLITSLLSLVFITSIYTFHVTSVSGTDISLASFAGKKILIVNIATESPKSSQLVELEQLRQRYADSLVVIAFPSNSFGHEPRTNEEIKNLCENVYHTGFLIAQKAPVTGADRQGLYHWLTNSSQNGMIQGEVKNDFQKYLIDAQGQIIGVFAGSIDPMDAKITNAVGNVD